MRADPDVAIIGAGPAGSAAAITLARRGHRVVLVDRAIFPRDKPCGDYCNPGVEGVLNDLGCLPGVLTAGAAPISTMTVVAQDGTTFAAPFPAGRGLLIPRRRLDAVLLERAAGVGSDVIEGFHVADVAPHDGGVELRPPAPSRRSVRARFVIAADGMRSTVARKLAQGRGRPGGRYTVGAYFSGFPAAFPRGELHLACGLYGGVARFGDGTANVCLALPRPWFSRRSSAQTFEAALAHLPVLADELVGTRRESAFRCTGPVGFATHAAVAGRVVFAGDAAGRIEPMTGQGIYMALRTGMLAGAAVASALETGSAASLTTYAQRRTQALAGKIMVARLVGQLAFRPRLTPFLIRRLAERPSLASRLLGVTGDVLSPHLILRPEYLWRLLGGHAHRA